MKTNTTMITESKQREIDKLIFTCYNKSFNRPMKIMIDKHYDSSEDFFQDVRLKLITELTNKDKALLDKSNLSTIVYNAMRWHYSYLFSTAVRRKTASGEGYTEGKLQRTTMLTDCVGSTLVSDEGENVTTALLERLAGSYEPDLAYEVMFEEVVSIITDIIPESDKYKYDILELIADGATSSGDIARKHGCSYSNISMKVRRYKSKIFDKLTELGYNIDKDLIVYT